MCRRPRSRSALRLEALDDRIVPAGLPTAVTDMTMLAQMTTAPDGPTRLYVNFDGATNLAGHTVAAFTGTDKDEAEILYRVAEIYAPFNVQVSKLSGLNKFESDHGSTTIFVGDDRAFDRVTMTGGVTTTTNEEGGVAPTEFMDYPTRDNPNHVLNSHPYDIAFADPLGVGPGGTVVNQSNLATAQLVAHEAGHTFGLAHTLSNPTDENMSYDDTNAFFANKAFNVTSLNFNPATGTNVPDDSIQPAMSYETLSMKPGQMMPGFETEVANITTQNSYTYLMAVLGARPGHDPIVADKSSVDPAYTKRPASEWAVDFDASGRLEVGEFQAFGFAAGKADHTVSVDLVATDSAVDPVLQVYDNATGALLQIETSKLQVVDSRIRSEIHVDVDLTANKDVTFVVSDLGADTAGGFRLTVDGEMMPYLLKDRFDLEQRDFLDLVDPPDRIPLTNPVTRTTDDGPTLDLPPRQEQVIVKDRIGPVTLAATDAVLPQRDANLFHTAGFVG